MLRNDLHVGVIALIRSAHIDHYDKIAEGWKMSADERRLLASCADFMKTFTQTRSVHDLHTYTYFNNLDERMAETFLAVTDRLSEIDRFYELYDRGLVPLPINGNDVIAEGWEGKEIGQTLALMRSIFFLREFKPNREEMLDTLSEYSLQKGKEVKRA